jgi:hypothetical protein
MDFAKVYPYVVPAGYVEHARFELDGFILPLGHEVYAMLVHDLDGLCRNVFPEELAEAGVSLAEAHERALDNLGALAQGKAIQKSLLHGPGATKFVLWSGHWLTASCIRLPGLYSFATKALKAETLCVSIPQREAMLLFPLATREERDQMRAAIQEEEAAARKLVTWDLFTLSPMGLQPFDEQ